MTMNLSVIVCMAPGREQNLADCLAQLKQQTHPHFEVIVVDDGSLGGAAVAHRFTDELSLTYLWRPNDCCVSRSRNRGAQQARYARLVFLDADILLNPGALQAYADWDAGNNQLLYGYSGSANTPIAMSGLRTQRQVYWHDLRFRFYLQAEPGWDESRQDMIRQLSQSFMGLNPEQLQVLAQIINQKPKILFRPQPKVLKSPHEYAWSGNFAVSKTIFEHIGGFDEGFIGWGGEDLEFANRAIQAGYHIHFSLDVWGEHQVHAQNDLFYQTRPLWPSQSYRCEFVPVHYPVLIFRSEAVNHALGQAVFCHYIPSVCAREGALSLSQT